MNGAKKYIAKTKMPTARQKVAIVGAGIGGLTAAIAFARNGAEVFVFEQAEQILAVGAGIQITPNGARVLDALGVEQCGLKASAVVPMDAMTGRAVTRFDLSRQKPSYRFYHRATLIDALRTVALGVGVTIRLGVIVDGVGPDGRLNTSQGDVLADVIVGADGVHSKMRSFCQPDGEVAQFTGQVAWRAIVPADALKPEARIWMAPGRHVVTYPLADNTLNVVAVQERATWAAEGWHHVDDAQNLKDAYSDCSEDLKGILAGVDAPHLWGLFRHPVAEQWSKGNVALLGDAAHPTLPFLAQGANLAIEDAFVLARCCLENSDLSVAFAMYQGLRKPRVTRAIAAAQANARNYHLAGLKRQIAFAGLKTLGAVAPNAFLVRLSWLYDHDVTR